MGVSECWRSEIKVGKNKVELSSSLRTEEGIFRWTWIFSRKEELRAQRSARSVESISYSDKTVAIKCF